MTSVRGAWGSLVEILLARAAERSSDHAFIWLEDGESVEVPITYGELERRARAVAARLRAAGMSGGRALLLYPPGPDYIIAFFGCLYAGVVAVPAYPPDPSRLARTLPRLVAIVEDSQAQAALTSTMLFQMAEFVFADAPRLRALTWITTDDLPPAEEAFSASEIGLDTLAFLQYTSGSTGTPKGVELTHRNLLHNEQLIQAAFGHDQGSKVVGWLPLYHDMGLIGNLLQPLFVGIPCVLMSPLSFLQRPLRWLSAISRHRATTSGGPNFAFDLCARKVTAEEKRALDLSSWRVAFNGAEPVRSETLERFHEAFAPCGFDKRAFYPCYGLAEATLIVSGVAPMEGAITTSLHRGELERGRALADDTPDAVTLVASGRPLGEQDVAIVDIASGARAGEGRIGEIWVKGASVARGYFNRAEETAATFGAHLPTGEGPFLRTGDLGVFRDGQLYITGRWKDLLILRGRNVYPQDVERTVERVGAGLRPGCGAAFSIEEGSEERLVVAHEIDARRLHEGGGQEQVMAEIRRAIAEEHEVDVHAIALLPAGAIPKTSSGKIQRGAAKRAFLDGSLDVLAVHRAELGPREPHRHVAPRTAAEARMAALWAEVLGVSQVGVEDSFFDLGGQSLFASQLFARLRETLHVDLPLRVLFDAPVLGAFCQKVEEALATPIGDAPAVPAQVRTLRRVLLDDRGHVLPAPPDAGEERWIFPCSFAQRTLWFSDRLAPGSRAYNLPAAFRIDGPLDTAALEASLSALVGRHEALRTTFGLEDGEPVQLIAPRGAIKLERVDVRALPESERLARALEMARQEAVRPFDLARGPLFRALLITLSDVSQVLCLTVHHIASDGWSVDVMVRELNALQAGSRAAELEPPCQYADFAAWQRARLTGALVDAEVDEWRRVLASAPELLSLPGDHPRPAKQTLCGATERWSFAAGLWERIEEVSTREGVTPFMLLLAALDVLLHRYTGQRDLVVGSPVANRTRREMETAVGYFINLLPLRTDVSGQPTFRELLGRVREACLDAYGRAEVPLEMLVSGLHPERSLAYHPIFQVLLVVRDERLHDLVFPGARVERLDLDTGSVAFDLVFNVLRRSSGLCAALEYATDLFDAATVQRYLAGYERLLEAALADPGRRISALPILSDEERAKVLIDWNRTEIDAGEPDCLHRLVEEQVARSPSAVAAVHGRERITYWELDQRANQLAHDLKQRGVGPEVLVGICVERSLDMLVGLYAILKAGGAYVPIDPRYPEERITFIATDARCRIILTQTALAPLLAGLGAELVYLDTERERLAALPASSVPCGSTGQNIAYLIYTSGSTGRPKGVAITLAGATTLVKWAHLVFSREALSGTLAATSICFDLSIFEIFVPLSAGGTVILAADALELPRLPAAAEVTLVNTVPSAIAELLRIDALPRSVTTVNLAGEPLPDALVQDLYARGHVERVYDLYGPSEDTTYSTFALRSRGPDSVVTIGRPIGNTRAYILDDALQPVPIGVPGELYLGGAGLSRGYLNRPALTAERFVPDPFGPPGSRLYRTGDLTRYLEDGNVEYMGRLDHQIKLRGFRIELGEIEAAIARLPGVRDAAVVLREDRPGDPRLVAYAVGSDLTTEGLRAQLTASLPAYMIPSALVKLAALPLSPNGKLDRKALPAPDLAEVPSGDAAPRTRTEQFLAEIYASVLDGPLAPPSGAGRVGRAADFFHLGGHSLLATRLISRVREVLGVDLPLRQIFETPVVADLAAKVDAANAAAQLAHAPRIPRAPAGEAPVLSFAQERLWFLQQLDPESAAYNLPSVLRLRGPLDIAALRRAFESLIARHEVLRSRIVPEAGRPTQRILAPSSFELPVEEVAAATFAERERIARVEAEREALLPFDLAQSAPLRARLLRLAEGDNALLLTMHHVAVDGWSLEILAREISALYVAALSGAAAALPELPIQYADHAAWQRQWLSSEALAPHFDYWSRELAVPLPVLELPTDRPRPPVPDRGGAQYRFSIEPALRARLDQVARLEGATLFMVLLAAFHALLHRYAHQDDILVGVPVAGRSRREQEGVIGCFVNTVVLRGRFSPGSTFRDLLSQMRERTLDAYAHQDLPFELLVDHLRPARELSRNAVFQVMFSFETAPMRDLRLPGLTVDLVEPDRRPVAFDLVLAVREGEGGGLTGVLEYGPSLFDATTIARMADHLVTLLDSAADDAGQRVDRLALMSAGEVRSLLEAWNPPALVGTHGEAPLDLPHPSRSMAHWMFEDRAAERPDAVAVLADGDSLTYAELDRLADRLAGRLRGLPLAPGAIAAFVMDRSIAFLASMLAVWKAGVAYVPQNPRHPRAQLEHILEQTAPGVLLTDSTHLDLARSLAPKGVPVIDVSDLCRRDARAEIDRAPNDIDAGPRPPRGAQDGNALAYIIFTSGSTGRPKGTMVEHTGMLNHMLAEARVMGIGPRDTFAQIATQTFDVSIWQFVTALLVGGRVSVFRDENAWEPRSLLEQMMRDGVTLIETVPTHLLVILEEMEANPGRYDLSALRWMMVNGEPLAPELCQRWFALWPGIPLINAYGPTECSDDTTNFVLPTWTPRPWRYVPIHGTLQNTCIYVLDGELSPVPRGVIGELCIGGIGVGRGYLRDPVKTALAFAPDPLGDPPGSRLYRTGDLVRFTNDGEIEFQGRRDHQVKIRGFRIEIGEIEATLGAHPSVRACVVLAREDPSGRKQLVAYVVCHGDPPSSGAELAEHLRGRLPDYMIPAAFVLLAEFPLLPSGKVDRNKLPEPGDADAPVAEDHVEPRTPTEAAVAQIWSDLLGAPQVSALANFFDLGGHSLVAVQVLWRVRDTFGVELPVTALFEGPTVAELAERIDSRRQAGTATAIPDIEPAPRAGSMPLSFAQERLWFLDQLQPNSSFYNISGAFELRGALDHQALFGALNEVIQRHEILRTRFISEEGQPRQQIEGAITLPTIVLDLVELNPDARKARVESAIQEEGQTPFRLDTPPLMRARLLRLAPEHHVLLFTMHHIVADGVSMDVLVSELHMLYPSLAAGEPSPLPDLRIQYADYAAWQRNVLTLGALAAGVGHFRRALEGAPMVLDLPSDRPRPPVQTFRGRTARFTVSRSLSDDVRALAQREGATLFMTLLAAFYALLHRLTGQEDMIVGAPVVGRDRPELAPLIGFFVNSLPLRARLRFVDSFRALLGRVRQATLDTFAQQVIPLEKIIEDLQPSRDLSRSPLFQVMFMLQSDVASALHLPGIELTPFPVETGTAKYDLSLIVTDRPDSLLLELEYSTDLFDAETIARLAGHYETLLASAVLRPGAPVGELPLLRPEEAREIVLEWNRTERPLPVAPLHRLFEAQVARSPDAVALRFEGTDVSYREVNRLSNLLARRLRAQGVGPDVPVAVVLERSIELIIGLMAVIKAGGAYVPVDPHYPRERVALLLSEAAAPVALTLSARPEALEGYPGEVVEIDLASLGAGAYPGEDLDGGAGLDNLCYIIFTSGSTGRPNGVMNTHRAVANNLAWMQEEYHLRPDDNVLQKTSFGFDVSVWELFWPLLNGARLVIARPEGHRDPHYLVGLIADQRITVAQFVPSMLQLFLAEADLARCGSLRLVICIGEALPGSVKDHCLQSLRAELHNLYGPTEAAISVTSWPCRAGSGEEVAPIGRPMVNVRVHILDGRMQPVPVGVAGELYLGGVCLARGYHRNPVLTARRFVPDPLATVPGERLYCTGDRARYRADGTIEFLGRYDDQIKVRGVRIEPAEIEGVLRGYPGVRDAAVVLRLDGAGGSRLVAYLAGAASELLPEALRAYLQPKLPEALIPSAFVPLAALPLTPNGKLDRRALPVPRFGDDDARTRAPAATPTEERVAQIWSELLGLTAVGRDDDFFTLGGHSLLATQIISRLRTGLGVELSLRAIFEAPTLRAFASRIDEASRAAAPPAAAAIVPVDRTGDLEPSFAQERLWFLDRFERDSAFYNISAGARFAGLLDPDRLQRCLGELARRHESLRTSFFERDGRPLLRIAEEGDITLRIEELGALPPEERERAVMEQAKIEARTPLPLDGALVRIALLRLGDGGSVLLFTIHHIIADRWSLDLLVSELGELYRAFESGRPAALSPPGVQMVDFARWQRAWLSTDDYRRQLDHWKQKLGSSLPVIELPIDRMRPPVQTFAGALRRFEIDEATTERLRALGRSENATLSMTLLAAFAALLHRYGHANDDLLIGSPVAGRNRSEIESTVGVFVNTLVLRLDLSGDPSFRALLSRAREASLDAQANQDVQFEKLVEEIQPPRDTSRSPIFQVIFDFHAASPRRGLAFEPFEVDNETSKVDLSLEVEDTGRVLQAQLEYNTDLFDAETITRMEEHLRSILAAVLRDADQRVARLPLVSEAERRALIADVNRTDRPWERDGLFHVLFEEQAARTPLAIAVHDGQRRLTYAELNELANRVAHGLLERGATRNSLIGLMLDRSAEFLTAMLGIWKSGAAYVPLDPALPRLRLQRIVSDGGCLAVLTEARHLELAREIGPAGIIEFDALVNGNHPAENPRHAGSPRDLAYTIFTSGSTGVPKGAMIEHRGMVNHLLAKVTELAYTDAEVVAQTATQSFDVSIWQFLSALLVGGSVSVFHDEDAWEPVRLLSKLEGDGVTVFETVPSHMRLIIEELEREPRRWSLPGLRWFIVNGEALLPELCERWLYLFPRIPLLNAYGPTECSDDVTHYHVTAAHLHRFQYVPISGTLPNLRIYVLDARQEPVPFGVAGELCVGGVGVGRGYIGDPPRTARAFIPDPFGPEPGARLYRTGDLVRRFTDGTIEFFGRMDEQIKIRGFRIEIGEIERTLLLHPGVRDAALVAHTDPGTSDRRLAAYVVRQEGQAVTTRDLAVFLRERLAAHMVPSSFALLDQLPLLPNGKVDRRALRSSAAVAEPTAANEPTPPSDALEASLATLWATVLDVPAVGREDNFFDLGGHSLLALQLLGRIRDQLGVELSVRSLFENPTLAGLARAVVARSGEAAPGRGRLRLARRPRLAHYRLAPVQLPEWVMHELDPDSPFYNVCLGNILFTGDLDVDIFVRAWQTIIERHGALRTTFAYVDGKPVQRIGPTRVLSREEVYIDRRAIAEEDVHAEMQRLALEYSSARLNFERGPTFTTKLAEFSGGRFLFIFVIHHILWDETSTMNLAGELSEAYNAIRAGRSLHLPALELEYVDYAEWVNDAIAGGELEAQRRYWLRRFETVPPPLDLPVDFPRPELQTFRGADVSGWLRADVVAALEAFAKRHNITLYILLMAVYNLQLHRLTGQQDFVVGTPIANRSEPELDPLLGLFASALPMRCRIKAGMTFEQLLEETRRTTIEAIENYRYPSVLAIQEINPTTDFSRNRLFSVMYGLQNNKTRLMQTLRFDGLEISYLDDIILAESETSKFDMTVIIDQFAAEISVRINYNTDLFKRSTAERMLAQLFSLAEQVILDPARPLSHYELLSAEERRALAAVNEAASAPFDESALIHSLFEAQAANAGARPALEAGDVTVTYRELDVAADRWAAALADRGLSPEEKVGLSFDPSLEQVIAMLAVLKAGGAYVPIPPEYPVERKRQIVRSAGIRTVLAHPSVATAGLEQAFMLPLQSTGVEGRAARPRASNIDARNLAYVLFTSGSTGAPKGIEIEHRGVVNLVQSTQRAYDLSPDDAVLFITPFSFDASILDVFWPLTAGARVVVPRAGDAPDPLAVGALIARHRVTVLQCVPLMLDALLSAHASGRLPALESLRLVICGGSYMTRDLRDRFRRQLPCRLANHYGPTEVTVDASRFDCEVDFEGEIVPLGRPIHNARVHVLDRHLQLAPIGVAGEICVASPGLARGYLGDPARTAAQLVPDPFSTVAGGRLYRTGDLGKITEDGHLHFLGRLDKQVKIRGNRIELEEIESRLSAHPGVHRCLVRPVRNHEGLMAFIELREEAVSLSGDGGRLRMFTLAQRPELKRAMDGLHMDAWPDLFLGDQIMRTYWPRLSAEQPAYQFLLTDADDRVLAAGNAVPLRWNGTLEDLPVGWDAGLERAFEDAAAGVAPDTLLILAGVTARQAQGHGLSTMILRAFKELARDSGLARVIVPVRPTGRADHPEMSFAEWCAARREDGTPRDPWLRAHERVGGRTLGVQMRSQLVRAPLQDWERWAGRTFIESGSYPVPGALEPVQIHVEEGFGEYQDPCLWMEHSQEQGAPPGARRLDGGALRAHLREHLPEYMIPERYRFLPALPLLPTGKIDERALLSLEEAEPLQRERVPPATPTQRLLTDIWKRVLGIDALGVDDDFFDLGGHSIKAVEMLALIDGAFGVHVGLRDLFKSPTIRALEKAIERAAVSR